MRIYFCTEQQLTTNPVKSQSANIANMAELWYSESSITIEKVKYLFETYSVLLREWNSLGASFLFLYLFLSLLLYLLFLYFFIYLFLSFFLYFSFIRSFFLSVCLSFYFFSIFLAPASKLFRVTCVNKLHLHFSFYTVKFGVPVFRGVPGCSGVPGFSTSPR